MKMYPKANQLKIRVVCQDCNDVIWITADYHFEDKTVEADVSSISQRCPCGGFRVYNRTELGRRARRMYNEWLRR